ncbi:hypothetical protein Dimus_013592, partial [Dionaea muscipula]
MSRTKLGRIAGEREGHEAGLEATEPTRKKATMDKEREGHEAGLEATEPAREKATMEKEREGHEAGLGKQKGSSRIRVFGSSFNLTRPISIEIQ